MPILSFDESEKKRMLSTGLDEWLTLHEGEIRRWAHENIMLADAEPFIMQCHKDKMLGSIMRMIAMQEDKPAKEKLDDILEPFFSKKGQLHIIAGKKRGGKTCLMYLLAEKISHKQQVWMLGPPCRLPKFISGRTTRLERVPPNSTVLIDDAGIDFYCRTRSMEKDDVIKMLAVLAHTDKNLVMNTQNTATVDVGFVRMVDGIWFKSYSTFQSKTERVKIVDQLELFMPNNIEQVLYYDNNKIYRMSYGLPEWWDEGLYSKTYSPFKNDAEMWRFVIELLGELNNEQIVEQVGFKNGEIDEMEVASVRMLNMEYDLAGMDDKRLMSTIDMGFDETPINLLIKGKRLNANYDFKMKPAHMEIWKDKLGSNPELELRTRRCVNSIFLNELKSIGDDIQHILLQVVGLTGSGKSYFGMSIGECIASMIKKPFLAKDICFEGEEIAERVKAIGKLGTIEMEEVKTSIFGVGSGRSMAEIHNMVNTLRESQISFIYTSPNEGPYPYHYKLVMFGIDKLAGVARALLYGPGEHLPIGFVTFSKPSEGLLKGYKVKKEQFMNKIKERTISGKDYLNDLADKLLEDPRWDACTNQGEKTTLITILFPHLSTGENQMVKNIANLKEKVSAFTIKTAPPK